MLQAQSETPAAQDALEKLCRTYWRPLYTFVRRQGLSPEDAQDLIQEFFARFLERKSLGSVRREKGRLRSYLLVSIKRFVAAERHPRKELLVAEHLLPNNSELLLLGGYIARRQGRWDESLRNLEKAIELDPRNFSLWQEVGLNYHLLRRYPQMRAAADQAVAVVPEDGLSRAFRAAIDLYCCANPRPLHKTVHEIVSADPAAVSSVADIWFDLALCEHDTAEIAQALAVISETGSQPEFVTLPRSFCQGLAARVRGDSSAAQTAFMATRNQLEKTIREQPQFASPLSVLGMADAALGRKDDAIREGQRAVELCSVSKDAVVGSELMEFLAVIYSWTGENELALDQLAATVKIPGVLTYGHLRLHPYWDLLRNDPRFDKILGSLAPR